MSNICKRIAKNKKKFIEDALKKEMRRTRIRAYAPPKMYRSFNIFTRDGENITVESKKPMTILEAQDYYDALSISGND